MVIVDTQQSEWSLLPNRKHFKGEKPKRHVYSKHNIKYKKEQKTWANSTVLFLVGGIQSPTRTGLSVGKPHGWESPGWSEQQPISAQSPAASPPAPQVLLISLIGSSVQCPCWRHLGEMGGKLPLQPIPWASRGAGPVPVCHIMQSNTVLVLQRHWNLIPYWYMAAPSGRISCS